MFCLHTSLHCDRYSFIREKRNWQLQCHMCFCGWFWRRRCSCSRQNGGRFAFMKPEFIQSPMSSGVSWYDLSSVQLGLIWFTLWGFLGRRRELMVSAAAYIIGAVVTTLAPGFAIMMIGRFLYGIGIGLAMHAAPMYIAETAASQIRGRLISLKEFFIVMGMGH